MWHICKSFEMTMHICNKLNPHMVYREDHTTDCWINLLRLPIITIVTSSLYNNIFFYATRPGIKGRESKNLQCEGIWYQCWDFVIFRFSFCQAFIALYFSRSFYLFLYLKKLKKVKIILTLRCTRGRWGGYATATAP